MARTFLISLTIALVVVTAFFAAACMQEVYPDVPDMPRGVTVVQYNGDVFFQTNKYRSSEGYLFKKPSDGSEPVSVAELPDTGYMQVVDGRLYLASPGGQLLAIDLDDYSVTELCHSLTDGGRDFVFTPDWIYGQEYAWGDGWEGEIFRVSYDGSERVSVSGDAGLGLQSDGRYLYYFSFTDNAIVKTDMDGAGKEVIAGNLRREAADEPDKYDTYSFGLRYAMSLRNGWIYYIDDFHLFKVRTNGEKNTDLKTMAQGWFVVTDSNIIVFDKYEGMSMDDVAANSMARTLSIMDLDGKNRKPFIIVEAGWPVAAGDYIYYWDSAPELNTSSLFRLLPTGREFERVYSYPLPF